MDPRTMLSTDETEYSRLVNSTVPSSVFYYPNDLPSALSPWHNLESSRCARLRPRDRFVLPSVKDVIFNSFANGNAKGVSEGRETAVALVQAVASEAPVPLFFVNFRIKESCVDDLQLLFLPQGNVLVPARMTKGGDDAYMLTLKVFEGGIDLDGYAGKHAEWILYAKDDAERGKLKMVVAQTESTTNPLNNLDLFKPPALDFKLERVGDNVAHLFIRSHNESFELQFPAPVDHGGSNNETAPLDSTWLDANGRYYLGNSGIYNLILIDRSMHGMETVAIDLDSAVVRDAGSWNSCLEEEPIEIIVARRTVEWTFVPWYSLKR